MERLLASPDAAVRAATARTLGRLGIARAASALAQLAADAAQRLARAPAPGPRRRLARGAAERLRRRGAPRRGRGAGQAAIGEGGALTARWRNGVVQGLVPRQPEVPSGYPIQPSRCSSSSKATETASVADVTTAP